MKEKRDFEYKMPEAEMEIIVQDKNLPHPGEIFIDLLEKAKLSEEPASKIAKILGISRTGYYDLLNKESGISPEMAVRLARFFKGFKSEIYEGADDPYFWWNINNRWLFINSLKNPKNGSKKKLTGLVRFEESDNRFYEKSDNEGKLEINEDIYVEFKNVRDENL